MGLKDLFLQPADGAEEPAEGQPAPASRAPGASSRAAPARPVRISSALVPGGDGGSDAPQSPAPAAPATDSGPNARVLELVTAAVGQVPANNALIQLESTMATLEGFIPDTAKRREAALKALGVSGVTAKDIEKAEAAALSVIDQCYDSYHASANEVQERDVAGKRSEAEEIRQQAAAIEQQISELVSRRDEMSRRASGLDSAAQAREEELRLFRTDVEAARAIARAKFSS